MPTDPALITGRLNVNDYVESRREDIKKLEELIGNAGTNSKKRAFQSLPRVERRRAASHDPKRVPRKRGLRKRAEFENLRENAKKRKHHGRPVDALTPRNPKEIKDITAVNRKCTSADYHEQDRKFSDRQKDKIWLPTHIWHRKRAFLTNIAGVMVPHTATQKQYRRTYRLATHLDERGAMVWDTSYNATIVARSASLVDILDNLFPGSTLPIFRQRKKIWQGMAPQIGPLVIHWFDDDAATLICHPLMFDSIWDKLASFQREDYAGDITLEDARFAIGSIDLLGPSTGKILTSTLVPATFSLQADADMWKEWGLTNLHPARAVINMNVADPRLFAPDHKSQDVKISVDSAHETNLIYQKSSRLSSLKAQRSQQEVDKSRKSRMLGKASAEESCVPVTVMGLDDGRVRVLIPRDWVLPFWLTIFKRGHTLIGGQQELHQLAFESGVPFYPTDFPETPAGLQRDLDQSVEKRHKKERRPKSKQLDYKHNLGDPYRAVDVSALKGVSKESVQHVRIRALERGVAKPGARIFKFDETTSRDAHAGRFPNIKSWPAEDLIGFITSGDFTMSTAKGSGIGVAYGESLPKTCIVKNTESLSGFLASLEVIDRLSLVV